MSETRLHNDQNPTTPITTIEKAFVITVNGNGNSISLAPTPPAESGGTGTGAEPSQPPVRRLWTYSHRVGAFLVGVATAGGGLAAIASTIR
ncbi:hypothetical protein [Streptomyces sp. NPDC001274]